ncbi:MAG: undecaprenyl-diphosphatase UppP [Chloroflexota bacterium]
MTLIEAIALGIIQGLTEFLPISSSGHLVLVPWLANWDVGEVGGLAFDAVLHLGTLAAVLAYFRDDIIRMISAVVQALAGRSDWRNYDVRLSLMIVIGSIPAAIIGILFEDWFEALFLTPWVAALALIVTAVLLAVGESAGKRKRELESISWKDAIVIGIAQALAIIPGISRSGSTISAGMLRGLNRTDAARFSFLVGIPAVTGAGLLQLVRFSQTYSTSSINGLLIAGFLAAMLSGLLAIKWLLSFLKNNTAWVFAAYCACFGLLSLVIYII